MGVSRPYVIPKFHFLKIVGRSNTEYCHYHLKLRSLLETSSCYFFSNDTTHKVSDHNPQANLFSNISLIP